MDLDKIAMNEDWKDFLKPLFFESFFEKIRQNYINAVQNKECIYPPAKLTFNAFNLTPLKSLKIILLGQDPYHQPHQAMGLSFSVPKGVKIPPSLMNIYKELELDLGLKMPQNGDLSAWARQGVLLLNSILTVRANAPASHQNFGWQEFSDGVIKKISDEKEGLVFMLWGKYAKAKKILIDAKKHCILEAAHPSPLARTGFLGCKHFSKANEFLVKLKKEPIDWSLD